MRTDFEHSPEIFVIALGAVAEQPFASQVVVLSGIGLVMIFGVYGLVAGIVKIDDPGLHLLARPGAIAQSIDKGLLRAASRLMKVPAIIGTAAVFMVGGGMLTRGIPPLPHLSGHAAGLTGEIVAGGGLFRALTPNLLDVAAGTIAGTLTLLGARAFAAARKVVRRCFRSSSRG